MEKTIWFRFKFYFSVTVAVVIILLALALCVYPAGVIVRVLMDSELKETGHSQLLPGWFESASESHAGWAEDYLASDMAETVAHYEVAETEWPMFGSVFYLVTAQELIEKGKVDLDSGRIRDSVERSAEIVASPETATWVRTKWGDDYLEKENLFYRMLLIMGLSSYESITGDTQYADLLSSQRATLAVEIAKAELHLVDDYPGECYPNDILWAVAAIQRAGELQGVDYSALVASLMSTFDGPKVAVRGLPAYQMNSMHGFKLQTPRGCGNSGIMMFASELDSEIAQQWYTAHERDFWKDNGWLAGFTEQQRGEEGKLMDVDSGPVLFEYGSVASAFGIGAANSVGRLDHSVPLTYEAVACSWPTPFGFLVPKWMGMMAVDSPSLGEVALLFSMSRPSEVDTLEPYDGNIPKVVWVMLLSYLGTGALFISLEVRGIRKSLQKYRNSIS
ncbi:MAG: hypothetical protein ACSHX8_15760 [Opitutaceae bacterium]